MKLFTFDDIQNMNISAEKCYELVNQMIKDKNKAILPPKISLKPLDGSFCNFMPSIISVGEKTYGGVKVVTRYPEREPSLDSYLMIFNALTGETLALMDANWITAMRTGAVAAHAIVNLAKSDYKKISFLGLGNTARATLLVLASIVKDRNLDITLLKYKGQEKIFADRFKDFKNITFSYADDNISLIKDADVVVSCITYTSEDLCPDEYFKKGVLVVPVHTRGFTNCDLFFDKVFADDYGHVKGFKYFDKFKSFAEMCDVVNGKVCGRENDDERILAYNIGLSIHDINLAAYIYELAADNNNLREIELNAPTEKFWL